jgi:hypothetical protein
MCACLRKCRPELRGAIISDEGHGAQSLPLYPITSGQLWSPDSVYQGLSAAGDALGLCRIGLAADQRHSFGTTRCFPLMPQLDQQVSPHPHPVHRLGAASSRAHGGSAQLYRRDGPPLLKRVQARQLEHLAVHAAPCTDACELRGRPSSIRRASCSGARNRPKPSSARCRPSRHGCRSERRSGP